MQIKTRLADEEQECANVSRLVQHVDGTCDGLFRHLTTDRTCGDGPAA